MFYVIKEKSFFHRVKGREVVLRITGWLKGWVMRYGDFHLQVTCDQKSLPSVSCYSEMCIAIHPYQNHLHHKAASIENSTDCTFAILSEATRTKEMSRLSQRHTLKGDYLIIFAYSAMCDLRFLILQGRNSGPALIRTEVHASRA